MKTDSATLQDDTPAWVASTIVYGVIPRNFGSEGLPDVTARLDYLKELGINALWLSPINVSPEGDFGYAVKDYVELNPQAGTKAEFQKLVQEAHARDIRVLMDFVPNHTSIEHPYFQDAQEKGEASPYYDWYDRDEQGEPTHYFNWVGLPNLNFDNPKVEQWMLDNFGYWVREFDVDGFRVDVAWGIKQRKPEFWPRWREHLKAIKPDLLLLAEASARDHYYFSNGFDAAYDWTDELGHWAWEKVWEDPEQLIPRLHAALTNEGRGFHPDARIFRFLNNNDTGSRFMTKYGLEMTRVAAALLLTLPGIPCVYVGDEVGAAFQPYSDPEPISWEDAYGLRNYYKNLITLRQETPALYSREWEAVVVDPEQRIYGYLRGSKEAEQPVLVLLNFSNNDTEVTVDLSASPEALAEADSLLDLLAEERLSAVRSGSFLQVPVSAWGARVLITSAPQDSSYS